MAFDSRKMRFFRGRVWQDAEMKQYEEEQRNKRRQQAHTGSIGTRRTSNSALVMMAMATVLSSSFASPVPIATTKLPPEPSRGPKSRRKY